MLTLKKTNFIFCSAEQLKIFKWFSEEKAEGLSHEINSKKY